MREASRILQAGCCELSVFVLVVDKGAFGLTHTFIATGRVSCDELAKVKGSICSRSLLV